jgi:hypothetical protein
MEKVHPIADYAGGQSVEERGDALRLDGQRSAIDDLEPSSDFAGRRVHGTAITRSDWSAWRQRQAQVRKRHDPYVDCPRAVGDRHDAAAERTIAAGKAQTSVHPTAHKESFSGERILHHSAIPTAWPYKGEFRLARSIRGRHRKTCLSVKLEAFVDANRARTERQPRTRFENRDVEWVSVRDVA